jgi:RNA polymerase sigma-70 factor (ECF subfamily)
MDEPPFLKPDSNAPGLDPARPPGLDPEQWVEEHGDALFGFAMGRVRNRTLAQDLVQETFLAAIRSSRSFAGRSTERSWLFGILRKKLADYYRMQKREIAFTDLDFPAPEEDTAFNDGGLGGRGWKTKLAPKAWQTPGDLLVNKEFQAVLKSCLSRLPGKTALIFLLREVDGVSSQEICKDLGVSPNNLWVILHRARMALRRCLDVHWF